MNVSFDGWNEECPSDEISNQQWNEGQSNINCAEIPLLVDQRERLDEHEDESITETTEEGERKDNRLGEEHLKWPNHRRAKFLDSKSLFERNKFVWSPQVESGILLTSLLGNVVHHDGASGFGNEEEVKKLDETAENELEPDRPTPVKVGFSKAANDWTDNATADGRENDTSNGVLLIVSFPHYKNKRQFRLT